MLVFQFFNVAGMLFPKTTDEPQMVKALSKSDVIPCLELLKYLVVKYIRSKTVLPFFIKPGHLITFISVYSLSSPQFTG